jgi:hypothetical protein
VGAAKRNVSEARFVLCVRNKDYPASLELRKVYQLLRHDFAMKHHQVRVIDESGEDYLYPEEYFVAIKLPAFAEKVLRRCCGPFRQLLECCLTHCHV